MLAAVAEKLRITEQKNSFKGAYVHHEALEVQIFACPVKSLARRVAHIRVHTSDGKTLFVHIGRLLEGAMSRIGILVFI